MNCCHKEQTLKVRLVFSHKQLIYDIGNYAFVEGDVIGESAEHATHQVKDIVQAGNIDRVNRILDLAHAECVEALYPYTKEWLDKNSVLELDDNPVEHETYVIELNVPVQFSATTARVLKELIHEYMVCRVLQDWLEITYPQSSAVWAQKTQDARDKMKMSLISLITTIRRPLKPF
jgi:hypothetical protein